MSSITRAFHSLSFFHRLQGLSHFNGPYHGMSLFNGRHTGFEYDWLRDSLIELCQKAKDEGQSMPSAARDLLEMNIWALKRAEYWRPGPIRHIVDGRLVSYLGQGRGGMKEMSFEVRCHRLFLQYFRCERINETISPSIPE